MRKNATLCILVVMAGAHLCATAAAGAPGWTACDFHQHSYFTDGSHTFPFVMEKDNAYGLDWWANSEHGGPFATDGLGHAWADPTYYPTNPIVGDGAHVNMWRWQSLRDYSFPMVLAERANYPDRIIFQAFEWNVPGHEHCSLGVVPEEFTATPNANALAEFEYKFDSNDTDVSGGAAQGWVKSALTNHPKAVEAAQWLAANYPDTSWMVPAHVERKSKWNVQSFRDLNNAAPTVAFGFESMPGHQKAENRGEYSTSGPSVGAATYGGCGIYAAQIGGLWDALLGEGRHFWLFASADFHNEPGDFYPGEYQKTWVYAQDTTNPFALITGLRSGNAFVVEGDLIIGLDFSASTSRTSATMGGTLETNVGEEVTVTIRALNPDTPNHHGDTPAVDHIQLITGAVTGLIAPSDPNYTNATNASTHIATQFTANNWTVNGEWLEMSTTFTASADAYFRVRGTNLGYSVPNETDADGNPLSDGLMAPNNGDKAFADLWFYSNPIFVHVAPAVCRGDCNCDGAIDFADIDYFVAAIPDDAAGWAALYAARHEGAAPPCTFQTCDINTDGHVDFADIDPFVALIPSVCP